ncbi:glutathione peroxidase [uncultured bacterium]|nr:glutathione peroxidase [uncultured bacterium]
MSNKTLIIGSKMPYFSLPGTDGRLHTSDDYHGFRLLLVVFSCNHCPYVHAYEQRLIRLQDAYLNAGLKVIAINSNDAVQYPEDSFSEMQKRSQAIGFNYPYLVDETQDTAREFSAEYTPHIFLFDEQRNLIYTGKIDDNWQSPSLVKNRYLESAIQEYLEGKPVSVPETFAIGCTIKWKRS